MGTAGTGKGEAHGRRGCRPCASRGLVHRWRASAIAKHQGQVDAVADEHADLCAPS